MNDNIDNSDYLNQEGVAIIGMAGRFPKAKNIDEYWQNLFNGVDCITFYNDEELIAAGIEPEVLKNPNYVKAKGEVDNVDMFDASFFGINPREAEVTDPQHRMLLECAWEAMEHACYDSGKYDGLIGVFGGKSMDYYLLLNVYPLIRKEISAGSLQAAIGNDKDSLTTTIAYRLNLKGPAVTIQTSSSTSLTAVCFACQTLLNYQCDMALAGGITAGPPIKSGYLYQEGNIWAPDGHCRAFDAKAKGFVPGSGMGMVVLKRLEDALADNDTIWAVIKGFAVNNDGCTKVSYSAPSVDAQAEVVAQALAVADVHPESIQYIETHGTGTNMGDPIEMTALTQAFSSQTDKKQYCAIGSAKTNIGHLDTAAGVAGLIKTAMALKYRHIPASLHFEKPNPKIDFDNSPFYVNTALKPWPENIDGLPRRAGVTSLGMGGTNAHVIMEEAPGIKPSGTSREWQLILLSAKTAPALDTKTKDLSRFLEMQKGNKENVALADAVYTLQVGRKDFNYRRFSLCQNLDDAATSLEKLTPGRVADAVCEVIDRPVVFMFSGQGAQYVNMAKELYEKEPIFKEHMDKCADILKPLLNIDLRDFLFPDSEEGVEENAIKLQQTSITQPVLFIIEYSLAQLWLEWGINPVGMIGHSIGEYTAACISGCMSLEDALKIVITRGHLMNSLERGAMLSVGMNETEITGILKEFAGELSIAAVNSPKHVVVSGRSETIEKLAQQLSARNIFCKQLHTSHAFHSPMMEPIISEFAAAVSKIKLNPPNIPFISGVTGGWISDEEACDPNYWAQQLRKPVRFSEGIQEILKEPSRLLLEVGPGSTLCLLAKEHVDQKNGAAIFSSLRHFKQTESDLAFILKTLGNLWLSGVVINWENYYRDEKRYRIPLPTYPFTRKRYWLEAIKEKTPDNALDIKSGLEGLPLDEQPGDSSELKTGPESSSEGQALKTFQPRPQLNNEYAEPTNPMEQAITSIWEDILGIQPIGIQDNFFDLGGHSLLATLFLSRLQEELNIRLELKVIFENPTIAEIAKLAQDEESKTGDLQDLEALVNEIEGIQANKSEVELPGLPGEKPGNEEK